MAREYLIVVPNAEAVGMHHWGPKQLSLTQMYMLKTEKSNPEDNNAVAVHEVKISQTKRAYLSREWAIKIQSALDHAMSALLKVREPAVVLIYDKEPQHNCTIIFRCQEHQKQTLQNYLDSRHVLFSVQQRK